jgi:subtilase-type serine protease
MNHPLHGRSSHSRSPLHSRLALAVSSSLLLAAAAPPWPANRSTWQQQRQLQAAWAQPAVSAPAAPTATTPAATATALLGNPGDAASWRSDEFNADWGLGAMGADYAYARGLTGKGVRLALFDTGSALAHPEFAGRNTSSITIGPNCATPGVVGGTGACGQTRANNRATTTTARRGRSGFTAATPDRRRPALWGSAMPTTARMCSAPSAPTAMARACTAWPSVPI